MVFCAKKRVSLGAILFKIYVLFMAGILIFSTLPSIKNILALPDTLVLSQSELENVELSNLGANITASSYLSVKNNKKAGLKFSLFNLIPIKTVNVTVEDERKAYLGGYPVGLSIKPNGVLVVSRAEIDTFAGKILPATEVEQGDIITEINTRPVFYAADILAAMSAIDKNDRMVELKVLRCDKQVKVLSYPVIEEVTGFFKLGLAVKDNAEGVGTVSYVKEDGSFGSLGHSISGFGHNSIIPCSEGNVYDCKIIGYSKGSRGTPGELKGTFINTHMPIGTIEKNNTFGVFGKLSGQNSGTLYEIASRLSVKCGKAQICTTIGDKPVFYDIEIIKTSVQNTPGEKGMIVRVTDKTLLKTTGGILQGMSGSPIIQNGKLIGVITHVMVNDPTKGYGVYLDWMFDN